MKKKKTIKNNKTIEERWKEKETTKIVNWITDNLTYKNEFGRIELSISLKQLELLIGFIFVLLEEQRNK